MPKLISDNQLNALLQAAARFPEGASIAQFEHVLGIPLPRRTLQRRLALLVDQQRLEVKGAGRASRYRPVAPLGEDATANFREPDTGDESAVPMSSESMLLRQTVRQAIQRRRPVGYNQGLLLDYGPNESFYLSGEVRRRLAEIGSLPDGELPAGTYARRIFGRLLIDLSWNSSRMEGNTYSLLETERLLQLGEGAEGKDAREAQMILNHKGAIELLVDQAGEIGFNRYTILNLHALLSENLLTDSRACGRLRSISVGIGGTVFHPLDIPQTIEECFSLILEKATAITDPFEQAFFVMVHIPYLQPFEDANKRVSRLAANIPLIRRNLCPLSFVDVPDRAYVDGILAVYEQNRTELLRDVFVWAYERSCARYSAIRQSLGEPDPFRMRYRQLLRDMIAEIVRRHMDKKNADLFIKQKVEKSAPAQDQDRLVEVAETEIMSLHEGNIARYSLRPSEYQTWLLTWE